MLWENLSYSVVKDKEIDARLASDGFVVAGNVGQQALQELRSVHLSNHDLEVNQGGMFYSVYSLDIPYRKKIFKEIDAILSPVYTLLFQNFKPVLHSLIVNVNGDNSEFTLHQDSTGLNEFQFSPLSVWIPLQDTQLENGCLCVVPHSHRIKVPYCGISFEGPFQNIAETKKVESFNSPFSAKYFIEFTNEVGLKPLSIDLLQNNNLKMHILSEPKEKSNKSLLNKFVALFK